MMIFNTSESNLPSLRTGGGVGNNQKITGQLPAVHYSIDYRKKDPYPLSFFTKHISQPFFLDFIENVLKHFFFLHPSKIQQ